MPSPDSTEDTWEWGRLGQRAPPVVLRRALDHLLLGRVEVLVGGAHIAGRVGPFEVGVEREGGAGSCSCGAPQPCSHTTALLAAAEGLAPGAAPLALRDAARPAFASGDPPVPVAAFPETARDLEVPADALSVAQRAAVESASSVVRKSASAYTIPREEANALTGALETMGTSLVVYARRPYVRLRATLQEGGRSTRLVCDETPGMSVRAALERAGYRQVKRARSLAHEFVGPTDQLHVLAEGLAATGSAVVLAEGAPPAFEPMLPPARLAARLPLMPVVMSRRRFEWWTPREGLLPLQLAVLQRHGVPAEKGLRLSTEGIRAAEREFLAAGLHLVRVDDPNVMQAEAAAGGAGEARVRFRGLLAQPAMQAFLAQGFHVTAGGAETTLDGPAANLPALAVALAQAGVHLVPAEGGWPPLPEAASARDTPSRVLLDDPRLPLAREGQLRAEDGAVRLVFEPQNAVLPRSLRIELYRMGWFAADGSVRASEQDAGRLVALLRDGGFEVKWPKPRSTEWRLSSVRYHERPRREGGGTMVHLKGPIPLGRLGGVDPAVENARIASIVRAMEDALVRLHPDARPLAHGAMPGVWTVPGGAGAFLLEAATRGASVTASPALQPIPLGRGVVLVDQASLPPRLTEFRRSGDADERSRRPVISPEIEAVVRRVVPEGLEVDEARGHYLVPSTRMSALVDALRELGAKVIQRRLAPRGQRYARWEPQLPEDATGARPKLRPPFRGTFEGKVPGMRPTTMLDPHQREGLAFILHHQHSCLLADEMGLGKTLTAISAAQFLPGRILVVCPASARAVWKQEVHAWTFEKARVLLPGEDVDAPLGDGKYVVVAYSGLQKFGPLLAKESFDLVILDESHYVKSRSAQRTRYVQENLSRIPRRLILSGTPVMNEPREIRTQLSFVHPEEWSDTAWFHRRFQNPWKQGTQEVKRQVLSRLRDYLEGVMLRREKRQALPDLPEKHLRVMRLQLPAGARRAYEEMEDSFRDYVQENEETALTSGMGETAGHLERLKQLVLVGKLPLIVDELKKILDGPADVGGTPPRGPPERPPQEKIVVFCHYREPINALRKELAAYGVVGITGSTEAEMRGEFVRRFQEDPQIRVFVGQTVAAGVAVTLTAARHAVFCDLEWNPALHRQAMDRVHRKTQTRDVEVHFFLAEDTVEEDIAEVLEEKTEMMDQLLEGRTGGSFGLRDKEGAQREVALRILSRKRRLRATAEEED